MFLFENKSRHNQEIQVAIELKKRRYFLKTVTSPSHELRNEDVKGSSRVKK